MLNLFFLSKFNSVPTINIREEKIVKMEETVDILMATYNTKNRIFKKQIESILKSNI